MKCGNVLKLFGFTVRNTVTMADYDYCHGPRTRQFSPLEVGEDNLNLDPKNEEIFEFINMAKQKVVIGVWGILRPDLASIVWKFCSF